jgi:hypothetical protein
LKQSFAEIFLFGVFSVSCIFKTIIKSFFNSEWGPLESPTFSQKIMLVQFFMPFLSSLPLSLFDSFFGFFLFFRFLFHLFSFGYLHLFVPFVGTLASSESLSCNYWSVTN